MATTTKWKEGDRVRIVTREVLAEDRRTNRYFAHMGGVIGEVTNVYGPDEIAIRAEKDSLIQVANEVHSEATRRLRAKLIENLSEEAKSKFTKEEMEFEANFVYLVRGEDLEAAK